MGDKFDGAEQLMQQFAAFGQSQPQLQQQEQQQQPILQPQQQLHQQLQNQLLQSQQSNLNLFAHHAGANGNGGAGLGGLGIGGSGQGNGGSGFPQLIDARNQFPFVSLPQQQQQQSLSAQVPFNSFGFTNTNTNGFSNTNTNAFSNANTNAFSNANTNSFSNANNNANNALTAQQQLNAAAFGTPQQQTFVPAATTGFGGIGGLSPSLFPQADLSANGNCQRYFNKRGNGEWLPNTLMPLSFDRASETKVGVFYAKFSGDNGNNDHVIVRLVNKNRSNMTMYTFKLYRVGSVSIFVSKLTGNTNGDGTFVRSELRQTAEQSAVNLTDTSVHQGFWFTVSGVELSLGMIGSRLIDPVIVWNDTLRDGPRDVQYFALTTDQSDASFGVNCDVPNLHFEDTCVTDEDCEMFPNTLCSNAPLNPGLDPGTRDEPYVEWDERDKLLKSCFCREGTIRIPLSNGCYDPIRQVVTLKDPCFTAYHCNDLPNTQCQFDRDVPRYNMSCQCIPGHRPFEHDPRTGLVEGCAALTDVDKNTILGCANRESVLNNFEWQPADLYQLERNEQIIADVAVIYVKFDTDATGRGTFVNDVAIIRLLDGDKNSRKMYSIKFYRSSGKIALCDSTRISIARWFKLCIDQKVDPIFRRRFKSL
jgi:hypothetical protein